jgi:PemK-like, MazF-like toxin of type II toxin-antitoxin system
VPAAQAPRPGEVIPFWYLWWREHERGEDSGRKLRPCMVVAVDNSDPSKPLLAVLPITHAQPDKDREALEIPTAVKLHLGLDNDRSWVICDEQNEFHWPGYDIGSTPRGAPSYGGVPDKFLGRVIEVHRQVRARGVLRSANRDD